MSEYETQMKERYTVETPQNFRDKFIKKLEETVCGSREQAHGNPVGTFDRIAKLWSVHLGKEINSSDVAQMMMLFKIARLQGNPSHADSWLDIAGYAACGAEINEI